MPADPVFDRIQLRRAFERAAPGYDAEAGLQREVADHLLERLDYIRLQPATIVDVGTGTGYCARALARRYRRASVIGVDFALGMLRQARVRAPRFLSRQRQVCADAAGLPLATRSADLVFSSLALQWCDDLDAVLGEMSRVLRPGGLLLLTTFGPDTLRELRAAWHGIDAAQHVNPFADMHVLGDRLVAAGLRDVVMDADRLRRDVPDVMALMRNLKGLGAHNVLSARPHGLTGRGRLVRLRDNYARQALPNGRLPVTYEVVYAHAWAPPPIEVGLTFPAPG